MEGVKSEGRICCYPPRFDQGSYEGRCFSGETEFKERKKNLQINTAISTAPEIKTFLD